MWFSKQFLKKQKELNKYKKDGKKEEWAAVTLPELYGYEATMQDLGQKSTSKTAQLALFYCVKFPYTIKWREKCKQPHKHITKIQ